MREEIFIALIVFCRAITFGLAVLAFVSLITYTETEFWAKLPKQLLVWALLAAINWALNYLEKI